MRRARDSGGRLAGVGCQLDGGVCNGEQRGVGFQGSQNQLDGFEGCIVS